MKKEIIGVDLVDDMPDYNLTAEENWRRYRERYRAVYGEYPPDSAVVSLPPRSRKSTGR